MVLRHRRHPDGQLLRPGAVACCMSISRVPVHAPDVSFAVAVTAPAVSVAAPTVALTTFADGIFISPVHASDVSVAVAVTAPAVRVASLALPVATSAVALTTFADGIISLAISRGHLWRRCRGCRRPGACGHWCVSMEEEEGSKGSTPLATPQLVKCCDLLADVGVCPKSHTPDTTALGTF